MLAFVWANQAGANFSGHWTGVGTLDLGGGRNSNCRSVELETRAALLSFDLVRGGAACDFGTFTFPGGRLENVGGILKANGYAVGRLGEDYFYVTWSNRPGDLLIIDARRHADGSVQLTASDSRPGRSSIDLRATLSTNTTFSEFEQE